MQMSSCSHLPCPRLQPLFGDWRQQVKRRRGDADAEVPDTAAAAVATTAAAEQRSTAADTSAAASAGPPDLDGLSAGLPEGWRAMWDAGHKRVYYGNLSTKASLLCCAATLWQAGLPPALLAPRRQPRRGPAPACASPVSLCVPGRSCLAAPARTESRAHAPPACGGGGKAGGMLRLVGAGGGEDGRDPRANATALCSCRYPTGEPSAHHHLHPRRSALTVGRAQRLMLQARTASSYLSSPQATQWERPS